MGATLAGATLVGATLTLVGATLAGATLAGATLASPAGVRVGGLGLIHYYIVPYGSRDASGVANSICLAKQADLEAVAFSCTGRRLARAAYGLGFRV